MDYGYLKFKAQNGKSNIFWEPERKNTDRKFGYRRKDLRHAIRKHPQNQIELEPDNRDEEDKTPKTNFIQRNRELAMGKNKPKKPSLRPVKQAPSTVTLTQEQLNAILASVGKVASGEEDNLRISIDANKNSITIESPRKSRDDSDYHDSAESGYDDNDRDDYKDRVDKKDKATKQKPKKQTDEEQEVTIFSLLEEFGPESEKKKPEKSSKKEHTEDKNKKKERKKLVDEKEDDYDNYLDKDYKSKSRTKESSRERAYHDRKKDSSRERDEHREKERSRKRDSSRDRSRDQDRRHYRKDRDKNRNDRDNSDERKYRKRDDSLERKSRNDREKDDKTENRKNKSKNKDSNKIEHNENVSDQTEEKIEKVLTPREMAGIPLSLPWKHMTLGERRRLMQARQEAEAAIKEAEKKKFEQEERDRKESREKKVAQREIKERERKEHESEKRERERKEKDDDYIEQTTRRKRKEGRERRRHSSERDDSDYDYGEYERRKKKDSRSHRRRDSPERSDSPEHRGRKQRTHRSDGRARTTSNDHSGEEEVSNKKETRTESKPPTGLPPPALKALTLAEKKKLQWEKEKMELANQYDPWGKPGAGAPIRTKSGSIAADYKTRQEETLRASIEEMELKKQQQKEKFIREMEGDNNLHQSQHTPQRNVPHAMRSSFIIGQVAPNADQFENNKELERRQWLEELDKQKEEKRLLQIREQEGLQGSNDTWADKLTTNYKPAGLPEQLREPPAGYPDPFSPRDKTLDGGRVSSAPTQALDMTDDEKTHLRGQNVFIDPLTRRELEDKRKRLLEHQQAVMEQVQQKQRQKQLEKERKMKEDMEEEMKLKAERDRMQRQFEQEQNRIKMKEARRQQEVDQLKAAMDEAHEQALREKMTKRMQHLEQGGHDTSQLKATLQDQTSRYLATERDSYRDRHSSFGIAKFTPRSNAGTHVKPTYVPGLDLELSPRVGPTHTSNREAPITDHQGYTENRVLTPSQFRHGNQASREFGTQTGMGHYSPIQDEKTNVIVDKNEKVDLNDLVTQREESEVRIMYNAQGKKVRVKSAPKGDTTNKYQRKPEPPVEKKKKLKSKEEKPKWNFQNKQKKKVVKQSEKDLNFQEKKKTSELRRMKREQELLNLVEMNRDRIPVQKPKGSNSRGQSPASDGGHTSRSRERYSIARRSKSHSPENRHEIVRQHGTYRMPSPNNTHRSSSPGLKVGSTDNNTVRGRSPPVPALRYKKDNAYDVQIAEKTSARKYEDSDPLDIPLTDGNFVPFTRTIDILDPVHAGSPLPISREATAVTNARKAYLKGMKPGDFGKKVNPYDDRMKVPGEEKKKDPIIDPKLVTEHPTQRQDAILQQLSSLKMNLMQRQRELETFSPTDFEH